MNQKFIKVSMFVMLTSVFSYAQEKDTLRVYQLDEVQVSDTKFAQKREQSSKIIDVISSEDLKSKQGQSLATLLSQVAGVEINGNQSFNGKNQGVYMRGGRNRQVAIYIDGVAVTDASGINLEYDLRLIPVEQIEKIEIMKGASSTLYGTGAAVGVINITLKKPEVKAIAGNAYWNFGTNNDSQTTNYRPNDFSQGLGLSGKLGKFNYVTNVNSNESKGMSEAAGENFEEDMFSRINVLQKVGFQLNNDIKFDFFGSYDRIKNTFDNSFDGILANADDLNNNSFSEQFRIGFLPSFKYNKGEFVLNAGAATIERVINQSNSFSGTVDAYNYTSRNVTIDAFNKYSFNDKLFFILGTQFQYLDMEQFDAFTDVKPENAKFNLIDPYINFVYNSVFGLNVNTGARFNIHSEYGNQLVYNINPSYTFNSIPLKLISSYSTAYISPSLYQLYGPFGNLDLTPEENATVEFGFETKLLNDKLTFNAVGFYREEENTLGFFFDSSTFESYYINIEDNFIAKGFETNVLIKFSDKLNVNANYSFTENEPQLNRLIPKHKANVSANYSFKKANFGIQYQYVDGREDAFFDSSTFATQQVDLSAYQLVHATISYPILENRLTVFGNVSNILNDAFQENIGYNTRGRNFKIGLNLNF